MRAIKVSFPSKIVNVSICIINKIKHLYDIALSTETPLTLATVLEHPRQMILTLVGSGAHLDMRNRQGLTALHCAAKVANEESIKVSQ